MYAQLMENKIEAPSDSDSTIRGSRNELLKPIKELSLTNHEHCYEMSMIYWIQGRSLYSLENKLKRYLNIQYISTQHVMLSNFK
jgi:hypothetical protein